MQLVLISVGLRVKRGAKLSTDHHLVVRELHLIKPIGSKQWRRSKRYYRIKGKALMDKDVGKTISETISSLF